jgi:large subunit ribosomal protein L21
MYAIIETGSKQYRVEEGMEIDIELLPDQEPKKSVVFDKVLFISNEQNISVGTPYVEKCSVEGEILDLIKGPKVLSYKYHQRKNFRRKTGHRQKYFRVKVKKINVA